MCARTFCSGDLYLEISISCLIYTFALDCFQNLSVPVVVVWRDSVRSTVRIEFIACAFSLCTVADCTPLTCPFTCACPNRCLCPISQKCVNQSDNGGSPWFGGLNVPLRSGKTTPYEGGVRVPGFAVDFTADGRHFGRARTPAMNADASTESPAAVSSVEAEASSASASTPASDSSSASASVASSASSSAAASASVSPSASAPASASSASAPSQQSAARAFNGMMHISDWLPTFLALAGVDASTIAALQLDGVNQARGVG